jgi:hypothetical protein
MADPARKRVGGYYPAMGMEPESSDNWNVRLPNSDQQMSMVESPANRKYENIEKKIVA